MTDLGITVTILGCTILAFISGAVPFTLISTGIILSLIVTGVQTPAEALSGFINPNVAMFVAMFVIGAGLTKTSILDKTQLLVYKYQDRPKILIFIASCVAGVLSVLTSSTAAAAIMLPLIVGIANEIGISRSKLLFPTMIIANVATGMTFLGQGASNMAFSDIMMKAGGTIPFTIWDFTLARIPFLVVSFVYVCIIGGRLLPDNPNDAFDDKIQARASKTLSGAKEKLTLLIVIGTIVAMLFANDIGLKMFVIAGIGACLLIAFHILSEQEALRSIHGPTVFLFAGVLPLSAAMKTTGAGEVVANQLIMLLGNTHNTYIIMAVFFIAPLILTQLMSNLATILIFVPLVSSASATIGIDPRALVMGVMIAGCCSILTPMASPAQTIIMSPGGYKLKDYLRMGLPLTLIITVMAVFLLPAMYPFH